MILTRCGKAINQSYERLLPRNRFVIECSGDGERVGTCTFSLKDSKICLRHGLVKEQRGDTDKENCMSK